MTTKLSALLAEMGHDSPEIAALADRVSLADLFPAQERALRQTRILAGGSALILAPTGTGKSLVAEAAMLPVLARREPVLWLVSTRTLARERGATLARALGPAGLRAVVTSRDDRAADEDIRSGRVDVVVAVYEKAHALFLQSAGFRRAMRLIVADEAQLTRETLRGPAIEMLLTLWRRQQNPPQIVALSSGMAVPSEFARRHKLELFEWEERPVPLRVGSIVMETGRAEWIEESTGEAQSRELGITIAPHEELGPRLEELVRAFPHPLLLFMPSRWQARHYAMELAKSRGKLANAADAPGGEDMTELAGLLNELLPKGVALHSADLTYAQRRLVEKALLAGQIDVCVCTATLAEGVNVGARTVLVVPSSQPGICLRNIFGRAGRPGFGPGEAYVILRRESDRRAFEAMHNSDKSQSLSKVAAKGQVLEAISFLLSLDDSVSKSGIESILKEIPSLAETISEGIRYGLQQGLWEERELRLALLPVGAVLAQGGVDGEVALGWRTMLRRFPNGGGEAANVFLALGGGQTCRAIPVPQDERACGRWAAGLMEELASDTSALAEYFRQFLYQTDRLPLALHQASKATLLFLERARGCELAKLESEFGLTAGIIEDCCSTFGYLLSQVQRLARLQGNDLAVPDLPPAVIAADSPAPDPAEPVLVIRRGSGTVLWKGKPVDLTRLQFRMLEILARHAGEGVTYQRIQGYVWTDAHVEQQQVSYLRRRIEERLLNGSARTEHLIETHASWGMRLRLEREQVRFEDPPKGPLFERPRRATLLNSVARLIPV